jgi:hypothetical protein
MSMVKPTLIYLLYAAIGIASLAWILISVLLISIYIQEVGIIFPLYGHRIFLVLISLPWLPLIGFGWLAYALQHRGQPDAAWATTFFSLMLWVLYIVGLLLLLLRGGP